MKGCLSRYHTWHELHVPKCGLRMGKRPFKTTARAPPRTLIFFAFLPLFSWNPSLLEPPRLHRDWANWTLLYIAGSVVVVTGLTCTPFLSCSGWLTLLLPLFLSPFLLFSSCPTPAASPSNLRFLVYRNIVCKVASHLTPFLSESRPCDRIKTSPTLDRDSLPVQQKNKKQQKKYTIYEVPFLKVCHSLHSKCPFSLIPCILEIWALCGTHFSLKTALSIMKLMLWPVFDIYQ